MPVALLPPTSNSGGQWSGQQPLTTAPRYARGPRNSRWHRNRNAITWPDGHTHYTWWCGPSGTDGGRYGALLLADHVPDGEPVCGTCEGRALGAGQDQTPAGMPNLRFDPRWQTPPARCPGSGSSTLLVEQPGGRCATCLACGDVHRTRATGGPYNPRWGLAHHKPGPRLVEPCPFHAWNRIVAAQGHIQCGCGWPGGKDR